MKLYVVKGLRLSDVEDDKIPSSMKGNVYIEGDVIEPNTSEAGYLQSAFPDYFKDFQDVTEASKG